MRYKITFCIISSLFLTLLLGCKDTSQVDKSNDNVEASTEIIDSELITLEKEAFNKLQENPKASISIFEKISKIHASNGNIDKQAIAELNLASIYDEYTDNVKKASHHGHISLALWEKQKDTMQLANLFKYCGYLSAKEGHIDYGKLELNKAEQLYIGLDYPQGKAITYFNMAQVHLIEKDYDRSERFWKLSKEFWSGQDHKNRIFGLNNFGIKLLTGLNRPEDRAKLIEENKQILTKVNINGRVLHEFNELIKSL